MPGETTSSPDTTTSDGPAAGDETGLPEPPPGCGDGTVAGVEECDEGSENGNSDCTEFCTVPTCGDGVLSPGESCDDGKENGTESGDCAPDCSKNVEIKLIATSFEGGVVNPPGTTTTGDLGGASAAASVDAACEAAGFPGYKAMFADGVSRRATLTPYTGDGQIDWVLSPWTRYVRPDGALVWVTDASALLGVEDGDAAPLLAPIRESAIGVRTGLRANWVTETTDNCSNWTSDSAGLPETLGRAAEVELAQVLAGIPNFCDIGVPVYCVEQ